jgi:hypothetical protein
MLVPSFDSRAHTPDDISFHCYSAVIGKPRALADLLPTPGAKIVVAADVVSETFPSQCVKTGSPASSKGACSSVARSNAPSCYDLPQRLAPVMRPSLI